MSKEVGDLSYEVVDRIWNASGASVSPAHMRYEFARALQEELASRCRAQGGNTSDNSNFFAANKAAEEGGLPELPELAEEWILSRGMTYSKVHMIDYARQAIAADRAARPVANKAEVEPSDSYKAGYADGMDEGAKLAFWGDKPSEKFPEGWPSEIWLNAGDDELGPFSEYDELSWCSAPQGESDVRYIREDLLATPPATTGASTVLTDERIDAAMLKYSTFVTPGAYSLTSFECVEDMRSFAREIAAQAGQAAPADLHDAIMRLPCDATRSMFSSKSEVMAYKEGHRDARHAAAELAAGVEAGQVVVPDEEQIEWSHDIQKRLIEAVQDEGDDEGDRQVMAEAACLLAALTGRAPSPAKESK